MKQEHNFVVWRKFISESEAIDLGIRRPKKLRTQARDHRVVPFDGPLLSNRAFLSDTIIPISRFQTRVAFAPRVVNSKGVPTCFRVVPLPLKP